MVDIKHAQLQKILKIYYNTRTPCFLWGSMGIGKSMGVREISREISKELGLGFIEGEPDGKEKFGFIDIRISQCEPTDLRGLPVMIEDKDGIKHTKWIAPNFLPKEKESKGILFLDEINLAPQSIQAACYQLILDRRIGDYKLPDGWMVISAGNTRNDKANVFELPAPLSNRFSHLNLLVPSKEEWQEWALKNDIDTSIISFLEFKPSYLFKFDKNNKDSAFCTPRSWAMASKLLRGAGNSKLEEKELLVSSAIGQGAGIEFMSFLRLQNKIDIRAILEKPQIVGDIKEIDLKYSLLGAITEKYREDKKVLDKTLKVCDYLEPEFAILMLRFMKAVRKEFINDIMKLDTWNNNLYNKYSKYLTDMA